MCIAITFVHVFVGMMMMMIDDDHDDFLIV